MSGLRPLDSAIHTLSTTSERDRKTQKERTAPLERTCAPAEEGTVEEVVGRTHGCVAAHHKSRKGKSPASGPIA